MSKEAKIMILFLMVFPFRPESSTVCKKSPDGASQETTLGSNPIQGELGVRPLEESGTPDQITIVAINHWEMCPP